MSVCEIKIQYFCKVYKKVDYFASFFPLLELKNQLFKKLRISIFDCIEKSLWNFYTVIYRLYQRWSRIFTSLFFDSWIRNPSSWLVDKVKRLLKYCFSSDYDDYLSDFFKLEKQNFIPNDELRNEEPLIDLWLQLIWLKIQEFLKLFNENVNI